MDDDPRPAAPSPWVECRFYGPLNDFLRPSRRGGTIRVRLPATRSVKDLVESLGVPHPEVAYVFANGEPVDFSYGVVPGDRIAVYPPFRTLDPRPLRPAGSSPAPGGELRFVLDGHLGRLAAYLRLCGFDTAYRRDADDRSLADAAAAEGRVLLTRDVGLLKRANVERGAAVRADRPRDQLAEVLRRFDLTAAVRPFGRCLACNGDLEPLDREDARDRVPPRVFREQTEFRRCAGCGRLFWRGSHHARMTRLLDEALREAAEPDPR